MSAQIIVFSRHENHYHANENKNWFQKHENKIPKNAYTIVCKGVGGKEDDER